jgi:hypothetical protein
MREGENYNYEVIRNNNGRPNTMNVTVDVVRGNSAAGRAVEHFNDELSEDDRRAGVWHFSQRTTKKAWTKVERRITDIKPGSQRK